MSQLAAIWRIESDGQPAPTFRVIDIFDRVGVVCRTLEGARGWIAGWEVGFKDADIQLRGAPLPKTRP